MSPDRSGDRPEFSFSPFQIDRGKVRKKLIDPVGITNSEHRICYFFSDQIEMIGSEAWPGHDLGWIE